MAKKKDLLEDNKISTEGIMSNFVNFLNKNASEADSAYILGEKDNPSLVKDWISTGSHLLDIAISNRPHGGLPVGRIVEFSGDYGTGKSLFCAHIAKCTQDKGGYVAYIDTEAAASPEFWQSFGLDLNKVAHIPCDTIEKVFEKLETSIGYFRQLDKKVPLTIIVDSIAGVATEAELEGGYGKEGFGTGKALILSKAMRKITNSIHNQNILVVFTNQIRQLLNAMPFQEQFTTPGGKGIPFHASVRVRLKNAGQIKDKNNNVIGVHCIAKVIKNRMGPPNREVTEDIYYDSGINAYAGWLTMLKKHNIVKQAGAYYKYKRANGEEWQFQTKDFVSTLLSDTELKEELYNQLCDAMIMKYKTPESISVEETTIIEADEELEEEKKLIEEINK